MKVAAPDGALAVFGLDGKLRQLLNGPEPSEQCRCRVRAGPRRHADRHRRADGASRPAVARLRDFARRLVGAGHLGRNDGRSSKGRPATRARRWGSACTSGRTTAPSSRSSRRRRDRGSLPVAVPSRGRRHWTRQGDVREAIRRLQRRRRNRSDRRRRRARVRLLRGRGRRDPQVARRSRRPRRRSGADAVRHDRVPTGSRRPRHLHEPDGKGYIVSVDQLPGESVFHVYKREGEPGRPHDHSAELLSFTGGADGTDGLDVTSARARTGLPRWTNGRDEQLEPELPSVPLARHPRSDALMKLTDSSQLTAVS